MTHRLRNIISSGWFRWVVQPLALGLLVFAVHPPANGPGGRKKIVTASPGAVTVHRGHLFIVK